MTIICPVCQRETTATFTYCGHCGNRLSTGIAKSSQPTPQQRNPFPGQAGDRRQLTVLFCDLIGSTAICAQLDPEDFQELIHHYSATCAGIVERFGGYVAEYMGDGILAYFGYPRIYEDDAERAVQAALDIVETLQHSERLPRWHKTIDMAVRIGIATGAVVTGDLIRKGSVEKKLIVGPTVPLAARLQTIAERNGIVIDALTRKLLCELFECTDLGTYQFKGFAEPVSAWRVIRPKRVESRFQAMHATHLLPLVDREEALALLLHHWNNAKAGTGRTMLLSGEAGIGKSRLVQALRERIAKEHHALEYYQCASYYSGSALYPIIEHMESWAGFTQDDSAEQRLTKLARLLARVTDNLEEMMPLFANLLSIPIGNRYPPLEIGPQRQKEKTFAVLLQYLVNLTAKRPVLLIVEDIHWIDPSSLELLNLIVERTPTLRLLLVCTFRPDFSTPWSQQFVASLSVERLPPEHSLTMLQHLGGNRLPVSVVDSILLKTDGIPLFLEELIKTLLNADLNPANTASLVNIPATLQDLLRARLDQLGSAKSTAQIGGAIGRQFSYELLAAVAPLPELDLNDALEQLCKAGLLLCSGMPPQATYAFKHALIQEAAYDSLLHRQRRIIHGRIADALEAQFPHTTATNPELLAYHFTVAELPEKAAAYWLKAGQRASERSANKEAVEHLEKGLAFVETLADTLNHKQLKLNLLLTLGATLINTKGPGHPEVQQTYFRARELCTTLAAAPQQFPAYWGLWRSCFHLKTAHELADKLLSTAQAQEGSELRLQAHHAQWATLFNLGKLTECCRHIDAGMALYDPHRHPSHATVYGGHDAKVCAHGEAALALWLLGFPDQAWQRAEQALGWAETLRHPPSLAHAYDYALMLYQYRREFARVLVHSETLIAFAAEKSLPHYHARGTVFRGWALAACGNPEMGIALLRQGIDAQRDTGIEDDFPVFLEMLAEVCYDIRRLDEGFDVLEEALTLAKQSGMRHWWAELYRRQGELLLARSDTQQAEAEICFREALRLAQRQCAKSLQLRVAMSLARLRLRQSRPDAAQEALTSILREFSEGWHTTDLREAKALLDTVSS